MRNEGPKKKKVNQKAVKKIIFAYHPTEIENKILPEMKKKEKI